MALKKVYHLLSPRLFSQPHAARRLFMILVLTTWDNSSQELEDYTAEVSVQHESLEGSFTFYDSIKASLNIYQVLSS